MVSGVDREVAPARTPDFFERCKTIVLAVDDNTDSLKIIKRLLEPLGLRVFTAASPDVALEFARVVVPDVVVSDLSMPKKDGYALLKDLRAVWARHPYAVPAIAITAYRESHHRDQAVSAGFAEYFEKPVDPTELSATIQRLVASVRRDKAS